MPLTQAEDTTIKHMDNIRIKEAVIHNLEIEVQQFKDQFAKQDKQIEQLEREHQKVGEEATASAKLYLKVCPHLTERSALRIWTWRTLICLSSSLRRLQSLFISSLA